VLRSDRTNQPARKVLATLGVVFFALVVSGCSAALSSTPDSAQDTPAEQSVGTPDTLGAFGFPDIDGAPTDSLSAMESANPLSEVVSQWTLREKVASLFLVHVPGTELATHQRIVEAEPIAGFLLLGNNIPGDVDASQDLVSSMRTLGEPDLLIAVDQEGGAVSRLQPDEFPSAAQLAEADPRDTTEATRERNTLVFDVGANVNLGVVADISPGEEAFIHERAFGTDVDTVTPRVAAALDGSIPGVAVAVKHFPGHGLTFEDTHETLGVGQTGFEQWRDSHATPFRVAIDQGVPMLMLGHLVLEEVDDQPASLSQRWVELLRDQWGYQGVIVTDDLSMLEDSGDPRFDDPAQNAVFALAAGADLIIDSGGLTANRALDRLSASIDAVVAAVESGEISETAIDEAAVRVLSLRDSLGSVARPVQDAESGEFDG